MPKVRKYKRTVVRVCILKGKHVDMHKCARRVKGAKVKFERVCRKTTSGRIVSRRHCHLPKN